MAIISNGTTNITIDFADETIEPSIDKVNKVSAGGNLKQQVGGERFKMKVKARMTAEKYREITNLLNDRSTGYYYTTEVNHPYYSDVVQPIPVLVSKFGQEWDNRNVHYISFDLEGISYI